MAAYLETLTSKNREQMVSAWRAWLRFLFRRNELLLPLHEELARGKRPRRRRHPLSHEQILQVLALSSLDDPEGLCDRAFLEVAYATGMRSSAASSIKSH